MTNQRPAENSLSERSMESVLKKVPGISCSSKLASSDPRHHTLLYPFHLRQTIGETLLTTEEFTSLLTQIEAILNSRLLEPLSDDPEDVSALTPGHFPIGGPLTTIPELSLSDLATSRLSRWQLIQQRVQHFWAQWSAHYLQRQQAITKWHRPNNNIKVGSIVLLTDERSPPCKWPLARKTELHPGKDGLTRVVTLKTATTILTRPVAKLAILPARVRNHQPCC
ncbi:uncharacterized protein [Temnothorax longispinosus]|uniref:uncharacterized protein n=1 Tax=Temnothorax longispinosus TaxID=300112 RepID=UPI003A99D407